MDRSWHTVTKYPSDERTHAAIDSKLFKKLDCLNNSMYQVELATAQMEYEEPIISGFLFHQNAELRLLELYYNFFHQLRWRKQVRRFGNEFEESLYLALVKKELEVCVKPEILAQWDGCDQLTVSKVLLLMLLQISSPKHFV